MPNVPPPVVDLLTDLSRAILATDALIAGIGPDQWAAPTPCSEWTVRNVVNHLVGGNLAFTALLHQQSPPQRGADHLGPDPLRAYRQSATGLQTAFRAPGVFDRVYQAPIGPVPGPVMVHLRIGELLVHGWDLAHATSQHAELPADLAENQLAIWMAQLGDHPRDNTPIGPAQPAPDNAPTIDRLAAYFGRTITIARHQP